MVLDFLIVFSVFSLSFYLFSKASGSVSLTKMNIISYIYYLFLLLTFVGGSLIFLGLRGHYIIQKILQQTTINKTYMLICYTAVFLPLSMLIVIKLTGADVKKLYNDYLKKDIIVKNEREIFVITLFLSILCIVSTVVFFKRLGYIPLLNWIFSSSSLSADRITLSNDNVINSYIKNLVILGITPNISYLSYIYYKCTKKMNWRILSISMFILSILVKTYNYSKTPVIFYLFGFILISIVINNGIKLRYFIMTILSFSCILVIMYIRLGYSFSSIDIYNGPIGRTIFTQVGTLFLHVDLFPKYIPYLNGRSISPTILKLLGHNYGYFRSGSVVMNFYSPEKVYTGVAGVMNSIFIGEAYANFGYIGALMAPIYVGIFIEIIFVLFLKLRKSPVNITIYIVFILFFGSASQGGFMDFIYNSNLVLNTLLLGSITFFAYISAKYKFMDKAAGLFKKEFK